MIKQQTINKLKEAIFWFAIPKAYVDEVLEMEDFASLAEDGTVEYYHSIPSLIDEAKSYGLHLKPDDFTFNNFEYVALRYGAYLGEIPLVSKVLDKKLLVNGRDGFTKITDVDFSKVTGREYFIFSHSEKRLLDEEFKAVEDASTSK